MGKGGFHGVFDHAADLFLAEQQGLLVEQGEGWFQGVNFRAAVRADQVVQQRMGSQQAFEVVGFLAEFFDDIGGQALAQREAFQAVNQVGGACGEVVVAGFQIGGFPGRAECLPVLTPEHEADQQDQHDRQHEDAERATQPEVQFAEQVVGAQQFDRDKKQDQAGAEEGEAAEGADQGHACWVVVAIHGTPSLMSGAGL
jgi:hypothetical protein